MRFSTACDNFLNSFRRLSLIGRFFRLFESGGGLVLMSPMVTSGKRLCHVFRPRFTANVESLYEGTSVVIPGLARTTLLLRRDCRPNPCARTCVRGVLGGLDGLKPGGVMLANMCFRRGGLKTTACSREGSSASCLFSREVPKDCRKAKSIFTDTLLSNLLGGFDLDRSTRVTMGFATSDVHQACGMGASCHFNIGFRRYVPSFLGRLGLV